MDKIDNLKEKIDTIDDKIIGLINERIRICEKIGSFKKVNNLPVLNKIREDYIIQRLSEEFDYMPKQLISDLYKVIFNYCKKVQE